jgi:Mrp family chromosome partitioning ATPase
VQTETVENRLDREARKLKEQTESYSRAYQRSLELGEEIDRARKRLHAVEDRMSYLLLETRAPGFFRVFSPALRPEVPVEGGRRKLALLILAAALAVALAAPLALDYLDPRVRTPGELEVQLGLPLTGWLPVSPANESGLALPASEVMRAAISIRRHLHQLQHRVLVVSALGHGGGSTTFCLAVAEALERLGSSTLVVEANPLTPDPRYGNGPGLLQSMKAPDTQGRLAGAGGRIPTGAGRIEDLLPVERLHSWLQTAGAGRDLILIDAAPLASSLATEELIRVFGSALLVVDALKDQRKQVAEFLHKVSQLAPDAFGAVLNNVDPRHAKAAQGKNDHDSSAVLAA